MDIKLGSIIYTLTLDDRQHVEYSDTLHIDSCANLFRLAVSGRTVRPKKWWTTHKTAMNRQTDVHKSWKDKLSETNKTTSRMDEKNKRKSNTGDAKHPPHHQSLWSCRWRSFWHGWSGWGRRHTSCCSVFFLTCRENGRQVFFTQEIMINVFWDPIKHRGQLKSMNKDKTLRHIYWLGHEEQRKRKIIDSRIKIMYD